MGRWRKQCQDIQENLTLNISEKTICHLNENKFKVYVPRKKTFISHVHKRKRLQFAKYM